MVSVHTPGFGPGRDPEVVRAAVERLGVEHPVVLDPDFQLWDLYGTEGWPSRYLFDADQRLAEAHFGEGGYDETERAIQGLLGLDGDLVGPLRPEDAPDALIVVPTADHEGPHDGPYEAGTVWAVVEGRGELRAGRPHGGRHRPGRGRGRRARALHRRDAAARGRARRDRPGHVLLPRAGARGRARPEPAA